MRLVEIAEGRLVMNVATSSLIDYGGRGRQEGSANCTKSDLPIVNSSGDFLFFWSVC